MSQRFYFDGIQIDRAAHLRRTPEGGSFSANARVVPVWRDRSLVLGGEQPRAAFLDSAGAEALCQAGACVVFLGLDNGSAYYAIDLSDHEDTSVLPLPEGAVFEDLRRLATQIEPIEAGYLAYARALGHWHRNHRFCGACGAPTTPDKGGHERVCSNEACGRSHFPRTDPAVIMLVTHPSEPRALFGRNKRFQGIRFSTLAGFVEPGESLEQAVSREVLEETGIRTHHVTYQASQPWPFPASIMLGFRAVALNTDIQCDNEEIAEAHWLTRDEVRALAGNDGLPPTRYSISRWLIDTWLEESE